jgi:uncharacterized protein (DUF1499 family)
MTNRGDRRGARRHVALRRLGSGVLALAILGAVVLGSAGLGYRFGVWGLGTAFAILKWSVFVAIAIFIIAAVSLALGLRGRSWTAVACAVLALLVAAGTAAVPLDMRRTGESVPRIHDITTDTEHPPEFAALRAVRERSPNGAAYGGPEVAAQQKQGYPDIVPVLLPVPPDRAFARAEAAARALGWEIVAAAPAEGRLEATATTRWFGFKDDVVLRVTPAPGGSRVDIRSVSRVGKSDLGANARRIRAFLAALRRGAQS